MYIKCENENKKATTLLFLSKKVNTKSQLREQKYFNLYISFQFDTTANYRGYESIEYLF